MAEQDEQQEPKIHVDSDWKAEAQREKERMAKQRSEQAQAQSQSQSTRQAQQQSEQQGQQQQQQQQQQELPQASFETLMAMLATQALLYLGEIADPQTGQQVVHIDLARHHIDLLGVLEDKTKGNISDEEQKSLASTIYELRSRYVRVANDQRQKG